MKVCSTSLAIREGQAKTKLRYHFISTRIAIIKKTKNNKFGKDVEKLEPSYTAGSNVKWYNRFGKQFGSFFKN